FRRYLISQDAEPQFVRRANERIATLKLELEEEERARNVLPAGAEAAGTGAVRDASAPAPDGGTGWRAAGIVVGAAGVAGMGAGLVFGLVAKNRASEANVYCDASSCRDSRGVDL